MQDDDVKELIEKFTGIDRYDQMQQLFDELFTVREKIDFALRWRLMKDLHRGIPQREIAHELGISLCKITRGSKILKNEDSIIRSLIEEQDNGTD
ncbi:MAG: trp operon repressor [Spirochaetia bacterium]|nr:trp operon repressor [Spirochaetia bacterium]MCF7941938.1 trp operon repressor [Spirochaetia bacterium]